MRPRGARRGAVRRADQGTISMFTVIFAVSVLVLAGLLVDGGLAIHARQRAADIAEQAARAGADDIDTDHLRRTGEPRVNTATACARAYALIEDYPDAVEGRDCVPGEQQVQVAVTIRVRLQLLSIVPGFSEFTMTSTASAHPDDGDGDPLAAPAGGRLRAVDAHRAAREAR